MKTLKPQPEQDVRDDKLHRINVYYPWLKFVVLLGMAVVVMLGGFGVGRLLGGALEIGRGELASLQGENDGGVDVGSAEQESTAPAEGPTVEKTEGSEPDNEAEKTPIVTEKETPAVQQPATSGRKLVALTFDDGPSAGTTGRLLDILKEKGVLATFFVVGSMARKAPAVVQREAAEGHEVGSHSTAHQNLAKLGVTALKNDVVAMDQMFQEILGREVEIMRPPSGAVSTVMRGKIGKPMSCWAVDPLDWKYRDAATVRRNVVSATFDGAVVLMHDIHASTVDAVAGIIDDLRAQGYEFLTVSELAAARGVTLANGVVYYHFKP